jgi:hypothetical protein
MKRLGIALIALGATIGYVHADNWNSYVSPPSNPPASAQTVVPVCATCSNGQCGPTGRMPRNQTNGGCATCGSTNDSNGGRDGKFLNFLLYRPTQPCQCLPEPDKYTPPLWVWFPSNGCTAAFHCGGEDCGCQGKSCMRPLKNSGGRQDNGCATCVAKIGAPVPMSNAPQNTTTAAANKQQVSPYGSIPNRSQNVVFANKPQSMAYVNTANQSQSVPVVVTGNKPQGAPAAIYPPSTIMPAAAPAVVPAAVVQTAVVPTAAVSPYGGLPGGYRVEPNRNVLPVRKDPQTDGQ